MPLRLIRVQVPRVNSQDVLQLATAATALTKELSNMSFFPPATAAVSIVLLILQTVQGVQSNKEACFRLVRRCARILLDINEQMEGRWETAPPTLLRNLEKFQHTLYSINEFMKSLTDAPWSHRFMKKTSIDNAIVDYTGQLDDAAQSFQIAALIDIHYAVSQRSREQNKAIANAEPSLASPPPPYRNSGTSIVSNDDSISSISDSRSDSLVFVESPVEMKSTASILSGITDELVGEPEEEYEMISDDVLDARGFRRYHQSEVRLKGRANLKGGWWAGASPVEVEGQSALIKRYEGPAEQGLMAWVNDVKLLQNVFHPNLPQMVGLSEGGAPTPFILLSHVQTRTPQALLIDTLSHNGLAACANLILHFYQDVVDAALYIQRQRGLDTGGLQDFLAGASFRVDGSKTIIMGLPLPRSGHWMTVRNYGLTESLKMTIMSMLPKGGTIQYKRDDDIENGDTSRRISHLVTLTRGLLPADDAPITLSSRVRSFINSDDGEDEEDSFYRMPKTPKLSLRQLRLSNINADAHNHTWNENGGIPPHKFCVGDIGYIPDEGKDFSDFVILGNVLKEGLVKFKLKEHAYGTQWSWKDIPIRRAPLEPFSLSEHATGWTMVVLPFAKVDCQITHLTFLESVADAWRFLLQHGKAIAMKHEVKPEELILITHAGTDQDFYIHDFDSQPPLARRPNQVFVRQPSHIPRPFGLNGIQHQMNPVFPTNQPAIMYLITSSKSGFEPYWSHHPVTVSSGAARPVLNRGWVHRIGWQTGFINWIQLHQEDFIE